MRVFKRTGGGGSAWLHSFCRLPRRLRDFRGADAAGVGAVDLAPSPDGFVASSGSSAGVALGVAFSESNLVELEALVRGSDSSDSFAEG